MRDGAATPTVQARAGEIDELTSAETRGVGVKVIVDGRLGYAWAADPEPDEAAALLQLARDAAAHATPDEANVLPDAAPSEDIPGLHRAGLAEMSPEDKVALALDLERADDLGRARGAAGRGGVVRGRRVTGRGGQHPRRRRVLPPDGLLVRGVGARRARRRDPERVLVPAGAGAVGAGVAGGRRAREPNEARACSEAASRPPCGSR